MSTEQEMPTGGMEESSPEQEMPTGGMEEASTGRDMPTGDMEETNPEQEMPTEGMEGSSPPGGSGSGQSGESEQPSRRTCGVMDVHYRLLQESPDYAKARAEIENLALEFERGTRVSTRTQIVRIPVVVHVVWRTATENISDAQIQSQIDVLNQDFRSQNPDLSQVPSVFKSAVEDPRIEFFLATQDPNGNPTSGINRTQTSVTSFSTDDKVKSSATGGANPWPSNRYLNIWVCNHRNRYGAV